MLAVLLSVSVIVGAVPASAQAATKASSLTTVAGASSAEVVLILAPYVTWDDISAQKTPTLWQAAQNGLIANINACSLDTDSSVLAERALTLGAGAPVVADPSALSAFGRNETLEGDRVADIVPSYLQAPLGENTIAYLGLPRILKSNASNKYDASPGLLGQTIQDAAGATAAIGNSDFQPGSAPGVRERPAAILAMNADGYVRYGDVSEDLLASDEGAPFGVRSDAGKLAQAMAATAGDIKASGAAKSFIVIDPGDLYRAQQASADVSPDVAGRQWADALSSLDGCYQQARSTWPAATIIVTSLATRDRALGGDSFGPVIVSPRPSSPATEGGLLTSASTHRAGLVTDNDLSVSVLEMLGLKAPIKMIGSPLTAVQASTGAASTLASRIAQLKRVNATTVSVEAVRNPAISSFVIATAAIIILGAAFAFFAGRIRFPRVVWACKHLMYAVILFVLAIPIANWLMFFVYRWPGSPTAVVAEFLGVALALWVILCLITWKGNRRLPLIVLIALTAFVIIGDQFMGASTTFTSLLGYSPIGASRYYGMGNEAAAILVGAIMMGCGLLADQYADKHWMVYFKRYGIALLGLLAVIVAAAPPLGANAGVAIWATMGFIVLWTLLNAKRFTWKSVLVMIGAVVALIALFILADLFLPGEGTHLGRLVTDMMQGGPAELWIIVIRKIAMNLRTFTYIWSYLLVAIIVYLIVVAVRPTGGFAETMKHNPAFRKAMISVLVTGIIAFCTEDSGIVMPALMVVYLGTSLVWLMLGSVRELT
ncbi:MAG: hypothetical protein FWF45_01195 [Coriobacteriia bacterium]|nr:hypothetical protein [Coriobacteriia bacterium]